jgi:predicted nucleic acid-binding Zn ribbon protein
MPRTCDDDDWDDDAGEDSEVDTTQPCPYCRRDIHEDAVRCPYCGNYLSREDEPGGRRSKWFYFVLLLCLAIAVGWALMWW